MHTYIMYVTILCIVKVYYRVKTSLQTSMNVIRAMAVAVKFAQTHLAVMTVLVKKVTHWISMALTALVGTRPCSYCYK